MNTFLHVGCGPKHKDQTTRWFNTPEWTELRLDIDKNVNPDIVGTMLDMSAVADASVDAVLWCYGARQSLHGASLRIHSEGAHRHPARLRLHRRCRHASR